MKKLLAVLVASTFALAGTSVLAADLSKDKATAPAADLPKDKATAPAANLAKDKATAPATAKLEKPANVTAEAWAKMTSAEKQKAVDAAKGAKSATAPKKEKKGGC